MNVFFRNLNIDIPIRCNIDLLETRFKIKPHQYFHITFDDENQIWLSEKLETWLCQLGLYVRRIEIFHTQPNKITGWHIDMNPPRDWVKINWIYETGTSYMEWGDFNINAPLVSQISAGGTSYIKFESTDIQTICRHSFSGPTLINSGVPHRIDNSKPTDRWCLSTILWYRDNHCRVDWKDAMQIFKSHLE
jgi:hypothetical protein